MSISHISITKLLLAPRTSQVHFHICDAPMLCLPYIQDSWPPLFTMDFLTLEINHNLSINASINKWSPSIYIFTFKINDRIKFLEFEKCNKKYLNRFTLSVFRTSLTSL